MSENKCHTQVLSTGNLLGRVPDERKRARAARRHRLAARRGFTHPRPYVLCTPHTERLVLPDPQIPGEPHWDIEQEGHSETPWILNSMNEDDEDYLAMVIARDARIAQRKQRQTHPNYLSAEEDCERKLKYAREEARKEAEEAEKQLAENAHDMEAAFWKEIEAMWEPEIEWSEREPNSVIHEDSSNPDCEEEELRLREFVPW